MRRRSLLSSAGALTLGALAGCLSGSGASEAPEESLPDGTTTRRTTAPTTSTPGTATSDPTTGTTRRTTTEQRTTDRTTTKPPDGGESFSFSPDADEPFDRITVGTRKGVPFPEQNRPHGVAVWNDADERRRIGIAIEDGDATHVERTITFPAGGYLAITLNEPDSYTLRVDPPEDTPTDVPIGRSWFDCNASSTKVRVGAGGLVEWFTVSTMMACPDASVGKRSFESGDGSCTSGRGGARIAVEDGQARIDGRIRAPNPCHDAVLAGLRMEDGQLTVTVGTTPPGEKTVCVQCIGAIPYETTVDFENGYPDRIVVRHQGTSGVRTVATWSG